MKYLICLPVRRGEKIYSLDEIIKSNIEYKIDENSYITHARNRLITFSQKIKQNDELIFDKYLFIDSDIVINDYQIKSLLQSPYDIISGFYPRRGDSSFGAAGFFINGKNGFINDHALLISAFSGVKKIDYVGAGALCISKRALIKMKYPYFRDYVLTSDCGTFAEVSSEDVGFCINAKENNVNIYLNTDILLEHNL